MHCTQFTVYTVYAIHSIFLARSALPLSTVCIEVFFSFLFCWHVCCCQNSCAEFNQSSVTEVWFLFQRAYVNMGREFCFTFFSISPVGVRCLFYFAFAPSLFLSLSLSLSIKHVSFVYQCQCSLWYHIDCCWSNRMYRIKIINVAASFQCLVTFNRLKLLMHYLITVWCLFAYALTATIYSMLNVANKSHKVKFR